MCALGKRENSALEAREIFICVRGPCAHLYRFGFANGKKNPRGEKSGKLKRAKGKKPLIQIRIDANERNARARTDGSSTPSVSRSFFSRADRSPHAAAGTYIFSRGLSLRARAWMYTCCSGIGFSERLVPSLFCLFVIRSRR